MLSRRKRNIYLILLTIIFFVGTPFIVLYSIGYRFDDLELFVKTGGITVVLREPNSQIFIDEEYVRDTNFLQKTYFFQSIKTGSHTVKVQKEGFQVWQTELQVYPEFVTETFPFMVPEKVSLTEIPEFIAPENAEDEAEQEENKEFIRLTEIFEDLVYESNEFSLIEYKDVVVKDNGTDFSIFWEGSQNSAPYYFCGVFECSKRITVKKPTFERIIAHDFYPYRDDVILLLTESGLYGMQIDNEQRIQVFTLYNGKNIDFYIENNERIYIQDEETISLLEL